MAKKSAGKIVPDWSMFYSENDFNSEVDTVTVNDSEGNQIVLGTVLTENKVHTVASAYAAEQKTCTSITEAFAWLREQYEKTFAPAEAV